MFGKRYMLHTLIKGISEGAELAGDVAVKLI